MQRTLLELMPDYVPEDEFPDPGPAADPKPWVPPGTRLSLPAGVNPRGYQNDCVRSVLKQWQSVRSTLAVKATGLGKTFTSALLARECLQDSDRDFLFLAHRRELVAQTERAMKKICPEWGVTVDMGDRYADTGTSRIVIASKDTISKEHRKKRFTRDRFGFGVIDECHMYTHKNKSYQGVVDYFDGMKLLGLTATPDRADEYPMGRVFETLAYQYDIQQAIPDGWLVPIVQELYHVDSINLEWVEDEGKDLNSAQLAEEMRKKQALHAVAKAAVQAANHRNAWNSEGEVRSTLVFAASVDHAKEIAAILNLNHAKHNTGSAAAVDCYMNPELREAVIERYNRGEITYLVNFGVLTTGFDAPRTRVIVMGRPTKVRSLYAQILGRGLRPLEETAAVLAMLKTPHERREAIRNSRKPGVLVVDIVGVSGQHKLVTAADVLGGDYTEEVVEEAKRRRRTNGPEDVAQTLAEAAEAVKVRKTEERRQLLLSVRFTKKSVSPFDLWNVGEIREPGWEKGKPASEAQKEALRNAGVLERDLKKMTRLQASQLFDEFRRRREAGLSTYKQSRTLIRFGYHPDTPFGEASRIIDRLIANNWEPFESPPGDFV